MSRFDWHDVQSAKAYAEAENAQEQRDADDFVVALLNRVQAAITTHALPFTNTARVPPYNVRTIRLIVTSVTEDIVAPLREMGYQVEYEPVGGLTVKNPLDKSE